MIPTWPETASFILGDRFRLATIAPEGSRSDNGEDASGQVVAVEFPAAEVGKVAAAEMLERVIGRLTGKIAKSNDGDCISQMTI